MLRTFTLLFLATAASMQAQQGRGTILGTVTDPTGAAVAGASVVVTHTGTNIAVRTVTNESGFFTTPPVNVGQYTVSAEKQGFKKSVRGNIDLVVDQRATINIALEIGSLSDSIEVQSAAVLLDTSSPTLGKVVEGRSIRELPLNGRNALALTLLTPNVKSNAGPTNSGFTDRGTDISSISINGGPNSMNGQMLDGNSNTLSYVGEVGIPPAVDAVEEFKVQSGTMSAEFGYTAGGVINLVTRSGTNKFHGTAYDFVRNDKLDARNTFATVKNPLRYNQFGASVGGPVRRDRTFFFFNFEDYRLRSGSVVIAGTPIVEQRTGDFSRLFDNAGRQIPIFDPATTRANPGGSGFVRDRFPGNIIPRSQLDPVAQKVLEFYPLPNRTPTDPFTNSNNFTRQGSGRTDSDQYHAKVDHRFSAANSLFGRYSYFNHKPFGTGFFADPVGNSRVDYVQNHNMVVSDTHTFAPSIINELRVGISRQFFTFVSASYGQNWPSKLGLPSIVPPDVMPIFAFGYTNIGNGTVGQRGSLNWDIQEMLTKIKGSHTLKFGINHRLLQGSNQQTSNPSGSFNFNARLTGNAQSPAGTGSALASFILGSTASATVDRVLGNTQVAYATSLFFQDDWRLTKRLTLNLGMRWDYQQKPTERNNGISNFDPFYSNPATGLFGRTVYAGLDGQPRSFREEDYNDLGPRFGFAYDVRGNGKSVLRGGYAIFYPSIFFRDNFGNNAGFASTSTSYPASGADFAAFQLRNGFPSPPIQPQGSKLGPHVFLGQGNSWAEPQAPTPMSQQWNLSLQQQLPMKLVLEATYTANRGTHFNGGGYDFNQLDPQNFVLGNALNDQVANPNAGKVPGALGGATISRSQSLRPFPYYQGISIYQPSLGNYTSNLFLLSLERKSSSGLTMLLSYTAGKIISDTLGVPVNFGGVDQTNENGYQNGKFDRRSNRSTDPTDVSQRAVVSLLYDLPFGKGKRVSSSLAVVNQIIGGWQGNTIGTIQTGLPIILRGANNNAANRPNSTGESAYLETRTTKRWFNTDAFVNPPAWTYGNIGRVLPDVRTPGTVNWDLSLIKNTRITERVNLQFRAEAFNFLNHVNLGAPGAGFSPGPTGRNVSGSFGVITSARAARVGQLGLKVVF
ncbi:MAG: carboxypeptidase regulatory-like domain-containing protein [Acidobacteria bacterium]|nr:carboxypeptidase regulatory-like domain-containing protein [Acidobacteriota bacterium]